MSSKRNEIENGEKSAAAAATERDSWWRSGSSALSLDGRWVAGRQAKGNDALTILAAKLTFM